MMKNDTQTHTSASTHSANRESEGTASSHESTNESTGLSAYATPQEKLIHFLETTLEPMGYELVAIEIINQREKTLRVFVDKIRASVALPDGTVTPAEGMGIEDCVIVTRALDEPLEANADVEAIFKGPYELEVSSPGIDRPLRKPSDYQKYISRIARVHTFRPLVASESQAETYTAKNPKQKNYYGIVRGFENTSVLFGVVPEDGTLKTKKGKQKVDTTLPLKNETLIRIPLELISKANLEPVLDNE